MQNEKADTIAKTQELSGKQKKGAAVIECFQNIPCNPCVSTCKTGAITMEALTDLPVFHAEKCVGCKLCVAACPGQAIFFVQDTENEMTEVTFPYEYLPYPEEGQDVMGSDRNGKPVCKARVVHVDRRAAFNKTVLVTLLIPTKYRDEVRFLIRDSIVHTDFPDEGESIGNAAEEDVGWKRKMMF